MGSIRGDPICKQLGLSEQADTIVGDVFLKVLSGGQQRRLSIALEVLTQPENFFLDEPTSGLDADSVVFTSHGVLEGIQYVRASHGRESPFCSIV